MRQALTRVLQIQAEVTRRSHLPSLRPWIELLRWDKPTGRLILLVPAGWALWLSPSGPPTPLLVLQILLGGLAVSGAGCIANDLWDRRIDGSVERTKARPLAQGLIKVQSAASLLIALLLISLLGARYLHWRLSATLNFSTAQAGGLSLLLLACEALLLASNLLQLWFSLAPEEPPQPGQLSAAPAVDVLLPSCGEPLAVVERSLRSCLALDYPRFTVWLLDDAARSELQQLAERLGCRY